MAGNASTYEEHQESPVSESHIQNAFASLATLFEKSKFGIEFRKSESEQLLHRFQQQLNKLIGTLNSSSLSNIPSWLFLLALFLSHVFTWPRLDYAYCKICIQNKLLSLIWFWLLSFHESCDLCSWNCSTHLSINTNSLNLRKASTNRAGQYVIVYKFKISLLIICRKLWFFRGPNREALPEDAF